MLQSMNPIVRLQPNTNEGIAASGVLGKPPNRTAKSVGRQRGVRHPLTEKGKDARAVNQLVCDPRKQKKGKVEVLGGSLTL